MLDKERDFLPETPADSQEIVRQKMLDEEREALAVVSVGPMPPRRSRLQNLVLAASLTVASLFGSAATAQPAHAQEAPGGGRAGQAAAADQADEEIRSLQEEIERLEQQKDARQLELNRQVERARLGELNDIATSLRPHKVTSHLVKKPDGSTAWETRSAQAASIMVSDSRLRVRGPMSEWRSIYDGDEWLGDVKAGIGDGKDGEYQWGRRFTKGEFATQVANLLEGKRHEEGGVRTDYVVDRGGEVRAHLGDFLGEETSNRLGELGVELEVEDMNTLESLKRNGGIDRNGDLGCIDVLYGGTRIQLDNKTARVRLSIEHSARGSTGLMLRCWDRGDDERFDVVVLSGSGEVLMSASKTDGLPDSQNPEGE